MYAFPMYAFPILNERFTTTFVHFVINVHMFLLKDFKLYVI